MPLSCIAIAQYARDAVYSLYKDRPKATLSLTLIVGCCLIKRLLESWQGTILLGVLCSTGIHIWQRRVQVISSSSSRTAFPASFSAQLSARSLSPIVKGYFKNTQLPDSLSTYIFPSTGFVALAWKGLPFCVNDAITSDIPRRIVKSWMPDSPIHKWDLTYMQLTYWNGTETALGELIVHKDIARRVANIFSELYKIKFPIFQMRLIEQYDTNINHSMENNNTFAFCTIKSSEGVSSHSYGIAIAINPLLNPLIDKINRTIRPKGAEEYRNRNLSIAGMIKEGDACHTSFIKHGFTWGGNRENPDYKHFEFDGVITYS